MNMRRSTMPAETAPVLALDIRLMNITSMLLITGLVVALLYRWPDLHTEWITTSKEIIGHLL